MNNFNDVLIADDDKNICELTGMKYENLVEIASGLNKKTGVVTSDEVVGATPASFLAHVPARYEADMILEDVATSNADLVLAKTCSAYKNKKATYDLLYQQAGYKVVGDKSGLDKSSDNTLLEYSITSL